MQVTELCQTCSACPSQWQGKLENGEVIYVRFRWGCLDVGHGETLDDAVRNRYCIAQIGDPLSGYISWPEMMDQLRQVGYDFDYVRVGE